MALDGREGTGSGGGNQFECQLLDGAVYYVGRWGRKHLSPAGIVPSIEPLSGVGACIGRLFGVWWLQQQYFYCRCRFICVFVWRWQICWCNLLYNNVRWNFIDQSSGRSLMAMSEKMQSHKFLTQHEHCQHSITITLMIAMTMMIGWDSDIR